MISLPHIFSDNALYQHSSVLDIRATAAPGATVCAKICAETVFSQASTTADANGTFSLTLATPPASLQKWTIVLDDGQELCLNNILFGELWLAAGQSNMEIMNCFMFDCDAMLEQVAEVPVRFYRQQTATRCDLPFTPLDDYPGIWCDGSAKEALNVTAAGTAFALRLAKTLEQKIPIGIVDCNRGATHLDCWLPREDVENYPELCDVLRRTNRYPSPENWNQNNDGQDQCCAMYNQKTAPIIGIRLRGIIWYQGEKDLRIEPAEQIYRKSLDRYYRRYRNLFAADESCFPMICVLIYCYDYGDGFTNRGVLNDAFIRAALEEPEHFSFVTIQDLEPVWASCTETLQKNHPIHPLHKYHVGDRLAAVAEVRCGYREGQLRPATLCDYREENGRLILRFRDVGSGLRIEKGALRCMYVAGKSGTYVPAQGEILSRDTMAVWHPFVPHPIHAAFAFNAIETGANLYAGEHPVTGFSTALPENRFITIQTKPFLNPETPIMLEQRTVTGVNNLHYHPVWFPMRGSDLCVDPAFTLGSGSIRISAQASRCGAYVNDVYNARLDLQNYAAFRCNLYNIRNLQAHLRITYRDGRKVRRTLRQVAAVRGGWMTYEADLANLPEGEIATLAFCFLHKDAPYSYVNLESMMLIPAGEN